MLCTLSDMQQFILSGDAPKSGFYPIDYRGELNEEQRAVVENGDGPCLVLAGAGSGKTRTVTYRVAALLERGADPASILLVTFTNKAAREMTERIATLLGAYASGMWSGTFHSIANRLLRGYAGELGYASSFSILDQEDAKALVKAVMKDKYSDAEMRRLPSPSILLDLISFHHNTLIPLAQTIEKKHPQASMIGDDIAQIMRLYAERKRAANVMDFDDLLSNWVRLVEHPSIGPSMSNAFRHIIVDEYQDTNAVQARIVEGLAQTHRNLLVVGDDAQSIYAFRGADVKNILRFPERWPGVRVFRLVTNYRSVPEILRVANASLAHNADQFEKELVGMKPGGQKPFLIPAASAQQEAQYIAEQIEALRREGVAAGSIGVLFRSSAHSQALEFELVKRNMPYEYRGGMKFFGRAHIKDVLAYVRIVHNIRDEAAWLRVLGLQSGIGAVTATNIIRQLTAYSEPSHLFDRELGIALSSRARTGWDELLTALRHLHTQIGSPADMIRSVLQTGYRAYLEREYPDFRDRLEDLEQLARFAATYPDVGSFLAEIALYDEAIARPEDNGEERLVLSTIHQAKGLEWDVVFLMHVADNAFPSRRALEDDGGLEEERRLFYVAVTRARNRLFVSYPLSFGYDGGFARPSLFLQELPSSLFERMELRTAAMSHWRPSSLRHPFGGDDDAADTFAEQDVITLDRFGERRAPHVEPKPKVAWKSSSSSKDLPKKSFLKDV